ncbi:Inner membrane transport permease YhhJ [Clostridium sp. N3C]|uniref:ABC transporter permease n=1 Tax=Clostridium sp. N3C TaxID=1776758 RepID=UPI00092E0A63|nr:ABC transporter permease [Clostridium sp. N3C]SCN25724.1 Inner membrane transport permease YhhJ [Clostridium sp. N3C]
MNNRDGSLKSQILPIVKNRLKLMYRNKLLILLCILLPLFFSMLVNKIFEKKTFYEGVPIAIIDRDRSKISSEILKKISENSAISVKNIEEEDIEEYISKEKVQAVYIFEKGMEKRIMAGEYEDIVSVYTVPGSLTAMGVSDIIAGEIVPYVCKYLVIIDGQRQLPQEEYEVIEEAVNSRFKDLSNDPSYELPVIVDLKTPNSDEVKEKDKDRNIFSISMGLGLIVIFSTIFMIAGCSLFIKERENRVRNRIKVSGVKPFSLLFADILSVTITGISITIFQCIFMYPVLKGMSIKAILTVALFMAVYIFAAAAMLALLASIFKSHISFQSFTPVMILIMGILSGCVYSLEMMPASMKKVAIFTPTYWAHKGLSEMILFGGNLYNIVVDIFVLLAMAMIFIVPARFMYRN